MMIRKTIFIALLIGLWCCPCIGQGKKKPDKELDVEVIDFGDDGVEEPVEVSKYAGNFLKISPTSFLFGRQALYAEHELNDWFSVQAGIGATFSSTIYKASYGLWAEVMEIGDYEGESELWGENDITDYYSDFEHRSIRPGLTLSLSPRFYFSGEGAEGGYLALEARYVQQRFSAERLEPLAFEQEYTTENPQSEKVNNLDYIVSIGNHYHSDGPMTYDFSIGGGIRRYSGTRQDLGRTPTGEYASGERKVSGVAPIVTFVFRMGYRF